MESNLADSGFEFSPELVHRIQEAAKSKARELDLSGMDILWLPEDVAQLSELQNLNLSNNHLADLPGSLGQLKELRELDASNNELSALPQSLGYLRKLQRLDISHNRLTVLPESLARLKNLQDLAVGGRQLPAVPDWVQSLTQLRRLDFSGYVTTPDESGGEGRLVSLPEWLGQLAHLESLDVSGNQLMALPESLRQLTQLTALYLHGNGALRLPPEVLGPMSNETSHENPPASPASILGYYFRTGRGKRPLNEAKLILVGRGGVGKTCLIKRLVHGTFDRQEPETAGVEIQLWPVQLPDGETMRLHIWDFGGQEILHATHQLFLTERTLYLLVLSGREGNPTQDAEYWLQLIRSLGGASRVIIALNKCVEHPFDVNRGLLLEKYPSVAEFIQTDCADPAVGLAELKRLISQYAGRSELRNADFPLEWFAIKERLAEMTSHNENFVTWACFQEICRSMGETEPKAQEQLADYLHVLGIALNYRDDPRLKDHHVLNPNWVTRGIYTLLRAGQKRSGAGTLHSSKRKGSIDVSSESFDIVHNELSRIGVLTTADLATFLDAKHYPLSCHEFLLRLMEKFQLCFRLPGETGRYLVPELLSENQPDIAHLLEEPCLRFQYQYEVLPEGLLPRFIVQTHIHSETKPHLRWRSGVVLEREGCSAVVRTDAPERRVDIHVTGPETRRRELLAIARAAFAEQHRDLRGLTVAERVPIPGMPNVTVSYRKLLNLEDRGITEYEPENLDMPVRVSRLLGGIESPTSRKRRQRVTTRATRPRPIHISTIKGKIHAAIITVRPDEYDALESRFEDSSPVDGGNNSYEYAVIKQETGEEILVVLTRCVGQGNTSAQGVANNIIQDIDPSWILLVGIAGGVADNEFGLAAC